MIFNLKALFSNKHHKKDPPHRIIVAEPTNADGTPVQDYNPVVAEHDAHRVYPKADKP